VTAEKVTRPQAGAAAGFGLPRHLALLGGTTTAGDCLTGLRYLAAPDRLIKGPEIAEYEQAFARVIGVGYGFSFSAGRVGLYGLLRAMGVGPGDEVLLQVPTHIVVANAVRFTGARPVYVDCRLDTYNIDLEQAERRITPRTRVLLLQHTFGVPVELDAALDLARRHGLQVIEDCVHALGATYDGRQIGSFGRAAFFSTEETKVISSTMGGMVVTDDAELAARMRAFQAGCAWPSPSVTSRYVLKFLAYYLLTEPHLHRYIRALYERLGQRHPLPTPTSNAEMHGRRPPNYEQRLSNVQAALAMRQLRRLDTNLAHRRAVARAYRERLPELAAGAFRPPAQAEPAFVRYPVWVTDRAGAIRAVAPRAVLGTWFTSVLEEAASPASGDYETGACPRAESAARHLVNLPTHPRVKTKDVDAIASVVGTLASIPGGS
jgi:dTDP-4-amino-4,6-dideoxygalactose transaminase